MTEIDPALENFGHERAFAQHSFDVEAGVGDHLADKTQNHYQLAAGAWAKQVRLENLET